MQGEVLLLKVLPALPQQFVQPSRFWGAGIGLEAELWDLARKKTHVVSSKDSRSEALGQCWVTNRDGGWEHIPNVLEFPLELFASCLSTCPFCPLHFMHLYLLSENLSESPRVRGVKNQECLWGKENNESDEAQLPSIHLAFNSMIMGTN